MKEMTKNEVEKFAVGHPYPTEWVETVLIYVDFDVEKANNILLSSDKTKDVINNTTSMTAGITECCGYDFGVERFNDEIKFCPICGKRIISVD